MLASTSYILGGFDLVKENRKRVLRIGDCSGGKAADHGVVKSRTRLSHLTFSFPFHALEKEMATHSSVLAWRIPGTGEPGGPPSMGSNRVGQD